MSISYIGIQQNSDAGASSLTINVPGGISPGDKLVVYLFNDASTNFDLFATHVDWYSVGSGFHGNLGYRLMTRDVDGTEPASYTFSTDGGLTVPCAGAIVAFSGVVAGNGNHEVTSSNNSDTTPDYAPTTGGTLPLVSSSTLGATGGKTPPSGFTELVDLDVGSLSMAIALKDSAIAGTGSQGTYTYASPGTPTVYATRAFSFQASPGFARATGAGAVVEQEGGSTRISSAGSLVETGGIPEIGATSAGIVVEYGPSEAASWGIVSGAVEVSQTSKVAEQSRMTRRGAVSGGGSRGSRGRPMQSSSLDRSSVETILSNLRQGVGYAQFRAWVGPRFRLFDRGWAWYQINAGSGATLDPTTLLPDTTLAAALDLSVDTQLTLANPAGLPASGEVWIGPGASGKWGWVSYENLDSGTGVADVVESLPIGGEYGGTHPNGAEVKYWWELFNLDQRGFSLSERMEANLAGKGYSGELPGYLFPSHVLMNEHLVLVQIREPDLVGGWNPWETYFLGWVDQPDVRDNVKSRAQWVVGIAGIQDILSSVSADGLKIGPENLAANASVQVSTVLPYGYLEYHTGEVDSSEQDFGGDSLVDEDSTTPWISAKFVGENNPIPASTYHGGQVNGIREHRGITQVHITEYPGQDDGREFIEVTAFSDTNMNDWLIVNWDYFVDFEWFTDGTAANVDISEGESVILSTNPGLFADEHPEAGGSVVDLGDYYIKGMDNGKWVFDLGTPTAGTFTLTFSVLGDGQPPETSGSIAYNATAADVHTALAAMALFDYGTVRVEGDAGGPWTVTAVNGRGGLGGVGDYKYENWETPTIDASGLTGGTPTVTGQRIHGIIDNASLIFDYMSPDGGVLQLYNGPSGQGQSQVAWGDKEGFDGWNPSWEGPSLPAMSSGETARMIYAGQGGTLTESREWWEVGPIVTPGYVVETGDFEWALIPLKTMDLVLGTAMTASSPAAGEALDIIDASENPSIVGLGAEGTSDTLQIGTEQITYTITGGVAVIDARAANGTTAAVHAEGDKVYYLEGGVATDGLPVGSLEIVREAGLVPVEHFFVYASEKDTVRDPEQANYLLDWTWIVNETSNASNTYTVDLSATNPRYKYLLIQIYAMADAPSRVRLDEVRAYLAATAIGSPYHIQNVTVAEAMEHLLEREGFPSGAIIDGGNTPTVLSHEVEPSASLWALLVDWAEMTGVRIEARRDGKLFIQKDPFHGISWTPPEELTLDRTEIGELQFRKPSGRFVSQVKLEWEALDGSDEGTVSYPATPGELGEVYETGPVYYPDEAAAQAAARKLYFQNYRPYEANVELAIDEKFYEAGDVIGIEWDWSEAGYPDLDRTFLALFTTHQLQEYGWIHVVSGVQIDREDRF